VIPSVSCGAISQYNLKAEDRYGVKNLVYLFQRQLTIRGFLVGSMGPKYAEEHRKVSFLFWICKCHFVYLTLDLILQNVSKWIAEGSFKPTLSITEGIEKSGEALLSLFKGENHGKAIIKLSD
jgi:NADPH-dependent curcumin reductase CurA